MKQIIKYSVIVYSCLLFIWSGCSDFEDINTDPNRIAFGASNPSKLMQEIIYSGNWVVHFRSVKLNGELVQYTAHTRASDLVVNYEIKANDPLQLWKGLYRWASNANHMYQLALEKDDKNYAAIAITLKVYYMEYLTAIFGDIPYSEALRWEEGYHKPKFDHQEDIYLSMLEELEDANALYDKNTPIDYPSRDLLYQGNIAKWQKFTNSLRLRLLMRISKSTDLDIGSKMQEILSDPQNHPIFESNDDAAILRFTGENPFFNQFGPTGTYNAIHINEKMGKTLMDIMNAGDDLRLPFFADAKNSSYEGIKPGETTDYIMSMESVACTPAKSLSTDSSPSFFMNYAELLFIKAEAAWRGYITGNTEQLYKDAVTASVKQWCGESANVTPMINTVGIKYNGSLEQIMEQKYVSQYLCGYEAWCDYRRTGIPTMHVGAMMGNKDLNGNPVLPTRFSYPIITQSTNNENYKDAVTRMGGKDDMLTPVWWASGNNY